LLLFSHWTSPAIAARSKLCWLTGFPLPGALMATIIKMDIGDVDQSMSSQSQIKLKDGEEMKKTSNSLD
jgi:hypothetical protein